MMIRRWKGSLLEKWETPEDREMGNDQHYLWDKVLNSIKLCKPL